MQQEGDSKTRYDNGGNNDCGKIHGAFQLLGWHCLDDAASLQAHQKKSDHIQKEKTTVVQTAKE